MNYAPYLIQRILFISICLSIVHLTIGATYYVCQYDGYDSNNGLSENSAWETLGRVSSQTFEPGDKILLKRGEIWNESVTLNGSGTSESPIVISAYGVGSKPVIQPDPANQLPTTNAAILIEDVSHWKVSELEISWARSGIAWINTYGSSGGTKTQLNGLVIEGCYIHDCYSMADWSAHPADWSATHDSGILVTWIKNYPINNNESVFADLSIIDTVADNCSTPFQINQTNGFEVKSARFLITPLKI